MNVFITFLFPALFSAQNPLLAPGEIDTKKSKNH